jgi:hypothetical protein
MRKGNGKPVSGFSFTARFSYIGEHPVFIAAPVPAVARFHDRIVPASVSV